jgi:glutathione S-transferase
LGPSWRDHSTLTADAAYPAQSRPGIETIVSGAQQIPAVERVFDRVAASAHVRANVYTDAELDRIEERDAPGITEYRRQLQALLEVAQAQQLPHEQIIAKLDRCPQIFQVLIIKTELTLPYTSVFVELDCGCWTVEAEDRLRRS